MNEQEKIKEYRNLLLRIRIVNAGFLIGAMLFLFITVLFSFSTIAQSEAFGFVFGCAILYIADILVIKLIQKKIEGLK